MSEAPYAIKIVRIIARRATSICVLCIDNEGRERSKWFHTDHIDFHADGETATIPEWLAVKRGLA